MNNINDNSGVQKIDLYKVDWKSSRDFFESLGEELDKLDNKDESYDFTWVGKRKAVIEAGAPINKTLRPNVDESKDWETTENLFIEGDNLDALKLLQESYLGKVKMIYIDPPYNTGKDFVYHDDFKASTEDYDEDTEYKDASGNIQFKKNEKTNGRYHSDWLSMMYPRLKLARNLLSDDGVIFISIDDGEVANLRKINDQIFGEENFVGAIAWKKTSGDNKTSFAYTHDQILIYGKTSNTIPLVKLNEDQSKQYSNLDNDPNGAWAESDYRSKWTKSQRPGLYYGIKQPKTGELIFPDTYSKSTRVWACSEDTHKKNVEQGLVTWGRDGLSNEPRKKRYLKDSVGTNTRSVWLDAGTNDEASKEVKALFPGEGNIFDTPKPVKLIKKIISIFPSNSLILDFFSGSGTTAHAVMQLNAEDDGNRKHIQVQLPEETDEKSEARKAGYKSIPEIARERIRRAGEKIKEEFKDELAKREKPLDVGFRTLTVADTNYKEVFKSVGQHTQESLLDTVDNVKEDRSELDLLYGVLVQSALELNRPIEKKELSGADVYVYDYFGEVSGLVACFADSVPEETIKEIAKLKPLTAVFKDSSFESSQDKVNLAEHFRIISPDTKVKVV
ncbi:site-specific DNA-methyltransferase [Candidatus Nomurabacteria bacterium]|nr:site-specific DNA-methyltransferase [Candidatus Nomurabacteria bacterium]